MLVEMARTLEVGLRIESPKFVAGPSVEGDHAIGGGGKIEHVVDDDGCGFEGWNAMAGGAALGATNFAGVIDPSGFELRDVVAIDLRQG